MGLENEQTGPQAREDSKSLQHDVFRLRPDQPASGEVGLGHHLPKAVVSKALLQKPTPSRSARLGQTGLGHHLPEAAFVSETLLQKPTPSRSARLGQDDHHLLGRRPRTFRRVAAGRASQCESAVECSPCCAHHSSKTLTALCMISWVIWQFSWRRHTIT